MAHVNQTITYYMCFKLFCYLFHCLFPRDPDKRKKKEKPTVWDSHNCWLCECNIQPQLLFTTFSHVTLTKERKKRNPQPQLLTVWVLLKRELLLHNIRAWHFRKIVGTRVVLFFVFFSLENTTCLSTADTFN